MARNHEWSDASEAACHDCIVAVTAPGGVPAPGGVARHLGPDELRALSVLADAGMIAPLRRNVISRQRTSRSVKSWTFPATKAS